MRVSDFIVDVMLTGKIRDANIISLNFDGYYYVEGFYGENRYYVEENDMPDGSGVYCIYRAKSCGKLIQLVELLYIGESGDIRERLENHEHYCDWLRRLQDDECLVFSFAPANKADRENAEAALIYVHSKKYRGLINDSGTKNFNRNDVIIITEGKNKFLYDCFAVSKNGYIYVKK